MNEKRPGRYRGKGGKTEVQLVVAWALKTFYFTLRYSRLTMLGWLQVQLHIRVHLSFFKFSSPLGEDRVLSRGPCVMQEVLLGYVLTLVLHSGKEFGKDGGWPEIKMQHGVLL